MERNEKITYFVLGLKSNFRVFEHSKRAKYRPKTAELTPITKNTKYLSISSLAEKIVIFIL